MSSDLSTVRDSVVKVLTQSDAPDYEQPWQTKGVDGSAGSALIVSTARGLRLLTNAHVVENQVFIQVRRYGHASNYVAEPEGIGHECDLALLRVEEESFFKGAEPIPIGELPILGQRVTVLGYPIGGERLSVTRGIVSRIEVMSYTQSQRRLLAVQIDAAINAGNSGGPVVNGSGKLVGVAFEALEEGDNIGYMIGAPVVRHFLEDLNDGMFDGFPHLGAETQTLESSAHRRALGLPSQQQGGLLVSAVVRGGSAWRSLRRGDVLLKIGSTPVGSDGSVRFRKGERIHFSHLIARHHVGDTIQVTFWRGGRVCTSDVRLKPPQYLVPEDRYDVKPTYFTYGGLLFAPLTRDFLKTWGSEWWNTAPAALMAIYDNEIRTPARQEVVILQKVMAHRVNQGYHDIESQVVTSVQGKKIRDLRQLVTILDRTRQKFVRVELADGRAIVLDRAEVRKRQEAILENFGIPRDRSEDLLQAAHSGSGSVVPFVARQM
jgi:S1-C subfamily serine protease